MATTVQPVLIALMVVLEVAVWQVRVALATRGRKRIAAALGAVNAVISVVALGQVVTNLDRPANIVGYAVGVAVGVYLGVVADGRFAGDPVEYRVVLPGDGAASAAELRARGWPVTGARRRAHRSGDGAGRGGRRRPDRRGRARPRAVRPGGFRTSSRLRSATWMPLPPEYVVMTAGARLPWTTRKAAAAAPRAGDRGPRRSRRGGSDARPRRRATAAASPRRADVQLGQDRRHVMVRGLGGDDQPRGDLGVAQAVGEQGQHVQLAGGEPGRVGPGGRRPAPGDDCSRPPRAAGRGTGRPPPGRRARRAAGAPPAGRRSTRRPTAPAPARRAGPPEPARAVRSGRADLLDAGVGEAPGPAPQRASAASRPAYSG